jgi:hypothetical protein
MLAKTNMDEDLNKVGELLMRSLRDKAIEHFDGVASGKWKAPALAQLQHDVASLSADQKAVVRRCVMDAIDSGIHDLLFKLEEEGHSGGKLELQIGGKSIADMSDGLPGEPYGRNGWQAKFSRFGERPDKA